MIRISIAYFVTFVTTHSQILSIHSHIVRTNSQVRRMLVLIQSYLTRITLMIRTFRTYKFCYHNVTKCYELGD